MNKQKGASQHSLGLAVAAATLGMSMGVSPSVVFASSDAEAAQESLQVAVANTDHNKTKHKAESKTDTGPGIVPSKVEKPGVKYWKEMKVKPNNPPKERVPAVSDMPGQTAQRQQGRIDTN